MLLWKNLILIAGAFAGAAFLVLALEKAPRDRMTIKRITAAVLGLLLIALSAIPYSLTMVALIILICRLAAGGVPVLPTYIALTAVVPMLDYYIVGFGGTLLHVTTPLVAGLGIIIASFLASRDFKKLGLLPADAAVIAFIVLSTYLNTRGATITSVPREFLHMALVLGGVHLAATRGKLPQGYLLLKIFAFAGVGLATVAAFETARGWPLFDGIYSAKDIVFTRIQIHRSGWMRSYTSFTDQISFSLFLASAFMAVWGLWLAGVRRSVTAALGLIILVGMVCTLSRTGGVALAASITALMLIRKKFSGLFVLFILGSAGLYMNTLLPEDTREGSASYRLDVATVIVNILKTSPLTGDNLAVAKGKLEVLRQGQGLIDLVNSYLAIALDGGLLLLAAFIAMPCCAWLTYRRWARQKPPRDQLLVAQITLAQLVGLCVGLAFTSLVDKNLVYVVMLSGIVTGLAYRQTAADEKSKRADAGLSPEPFGQGALATGNHAFLPRPVRPFSSGNEHER